MPIVFQNSNGTLSIPDTWKDKAQKEVLKHIRDKGMTIEGYDKLKAYNPATKFKTRYRENDDNSIDMIIGASVVDEIVTGYLPKPSYFVLRHTPNDKLIGKDKYELVRVASTDIVQGFHFEMDVEEVENHLEAATKEGVDYFGN